MNTSTAGNVVIFESTGRAVTNVAITVNARNAPHALDVALTAIQRYATTNNLIISTSTYTIEAASADVYVVTLTNDN